MAFVDSAIRGGAHNQAQASTELREKFSWKSYCARYGTARQKWHTVYMDFWNF